MRGDLLELLINPYTGNRLERGTDSLVDTITRERFPIRNGIPAILRREEVRGLNRLYQKRYDGWAYLYDLIMGAVVAWLPGAREAFRQIAEIIEVQSSDRVLETSIGTGMEIANLVKHGKRADFFGLDLSHGMLKKCRRNAGNWKLDIGLVQGNAETVPFRDETFVARHDGAGKALHVLGRIEETMKRLSEIPERGAYPRELLGLGIREFREVFFKPYRIIYRVLGNAVYVHLIADGRRDMQTLLERRMLPA